MSLAKELISNANLKPTKARVAVLNLIAVSDTALSHTEILERLQEKHEVDRVTVYRVLEWLTEYNFIHKITGDNRAWKFQFSSDIPSHDNTQLLPSKSHQHAHLHCRNCGRVLCMHDLFLNLDKDLYSRFKIDQIEINLKGQCPDCLNAQ